MRYTKLTSEQIVKEFSDPEHYFPQDFLFKEMENILMEGGPEAEKAEAFLRDLLDSNEADDFKVTVLRYLLALDYMDKETWEKLKKFPEESYDNKVIYQKASEPVTVVRAEGV